MTEKAESQRILAVASWGGHWMQLRRLTPAFEGHEVMFLIAGGPPGKPRSSSSLDVGTGESCRLYRVINATRWTPVRMVFSALQVLWVMLRARPDTVISTGAAPGLVALQMGRWMGSRTIWIDSIANVDQISMSGRLARRCSDLYLTQWPHLADENGGPRYMGAVM